MMAVVVESYGKDRDKEEAVDATLLLILTLFVRNFNVCEQGMLLDRNSKCSINVHAAKVSAKIHR